MTPLPQNPPETQIQSNLNSAVQDSQESMKMSSFINFDPAGAEKDDVKTRQSTPKSPPVGPARRAMVLEVRPESAHRDF